MKQNLLFLKCALLTMNFIFLSSCSNTNSGDLDSTSSIKGPPSESGCKCKKSDIQTVAYKFINEFDQSQNNLSSDIARTISLNDIRDNGNCTWQVEFKISWPFGNTDGAHPDSYITKTGYCNTNQVYLQ